MTDQEAQRTPSRINAEKYDTKSYHFQKLQKIKDKEKVLKEARGKKMAIETQRLRITRELLGGPVVRTQHFHCQGLGSIPGQGTKIPQASQCGQKKKKKNYC